MKQTSPYGRGGVLSFDRSLPRFLLQLVGFLPTQKRHRNLGGGWLIDKPFRMVLHSHPKSRSIMFRERVSSTPIYNQSRMGSLQSLVGMAYVKVLRFLYMEDFAVFGKGFGVFSIRAGMMLVIRGRSDFLMSGLSGLTHFVSTKERPCFFLFIFLFYYVVSLSFVISKA